ncbi:esterase-like activity of phytase family protein [Methyloversatilis sp.]|uniref:esterase-like activity of phytase family protein n=1 Tax=Methyloversatilis sp. TaxID=2569862 RepID=UPI002735B21E|nr:esterase-like activity of phytase family protein [Methyloversatilis sp.]MDP2867182.1 esterase-like activity of phytase family protein [Methyloversatilis sp.]MDP3455332.1 esterase-like activity of phytase family protein [Methyloversatilis sp.]MDP3577068.1 esterase-like activity of phytase family protein [Methyloversatilis sp.]
MKKTLLVALVATFAGHALAADFSLRVIGEQRIATGTLFEGVEFGGISGLDRAADGRYWAISDDRGGERGTPRFYNLSLDYDAAGFNGVTLNSQTFMQRPDGSTFPSNARTVDPEGIRMAPNGNLYWSSEGNWSGNAASRYQPFVREMTTSGAFVREFATPAMFNYVDNATTGGRSNKLFEALTVAPGGTIWTANEDALVQDGPLTSVSNGSVVRVTALDPVSGAAGAQYVYELPPIPVDAVPGAPFGPDNGLPELLAISDTQFIAVERAFAFGVGNTIRLTLAEIMPDTTDVSSFTSLIGATYTPMRRELLLEMPIAFEGITLDNIEAISWGHTLANGNRTLVLAADNNFSGTQVTQFIALEVSAVPEPTRIVQFLAGLGLMTLTLRMRRR